MTTKNLSVTIGKHTQNGENMSNPNVISVTAPCPNITTPVLSYTAMINGFSGTEPAKERKNNLGRPCSFPGCAKMEHQGWFVQTLPDCQQLFYGDEHNIVTYFCPSVRKEVAFDSMINANPQDMISRTPDSDYNYQDTYAYPCSSHGSQNAWFGPHHPNMQQQQQHYANPSMQQQSQSLPFAGTFPIGHAVHHQSHMLPIPASQPMHGGNNHQKSSSLSNISTFVQPRAAPPPLPPPLPRPTSILRAAAVPPTTVVSSPLQDAKKTEEEDDDDGQKSVGSEESDDESFQSNGETGDKSAAAAAAASDAVADSNVPIDTDGTKQDMSPNDETNKPDSDGSTNDATLVAALMHSTVKTVNYSTGTSESTDEEQQQPCIISALKKEKLKGIKANIEKGKFLDIVEVESNTSVTNELTGLTMYHPVCWYFNNSGCRHGVKCMNAHEDRACWKDATWNDVDWLICVNDKEIKRLSADYKKQRDKKGGKKKF